MKNHPQTVVGIDIGTHSTRVVIGRVNTEDGNIVEVVGLGKAPSTGLRKGTIVDLTGPMQALDTALGEAERMAGLDVTAAVFSINGSHILSTKTDGMVAVTNPDKQVTRDDILRLENVATVGKIPENRAVLEIIPHEYKLDGQGNIREPIGMTGTRLEVNAHVVSALEPSLANVQKVAEEVKVYPAAFVVAGEAAAKSSLTQNQIENGVALIDFGGATTNVAIFEEGDLRFVSVVPLGGMHITNDLAIGLKIDPVVAEMVKIRFAGAEREQFGEVKFNHDGESYVFENDTINEIVEARLDEIFEAVQKELRRAGYSGKLPAGVVLTGGSANLRGVGDYVKKNLGLAVKIGKPTGFKSAVENLELPEYATAIGLMAIDLEASHQFGGSKPKNKKANKVQSKSLGELISGFFGNFKV